MPQTTIGPEALQAFESHAKSLGIGAIGYAKLPRLFVTKQGCTVCIKECPFSKMPYEDINKAFVP